MASFDLTDRVAIVTGSSQGLGKAMALALADHGADIVVVARRPEGIQGRGAERPHESVEPAVEEIKARGRRAIGVTADIRGEGEVARMVGEAINAFGRIDVLVNNAGGSWGESFTTGPLLEVTGADFDETFRLNVKTVFLCSRAVVPIMKGQGKGSIINTSSSAARYPTAGRAFYGAAKAAVSQLTRIMAQEWGPEVRVNAVAPGGVVNARPMAPGTEGQGNRQAGNVALGRLGTPEEFAGAVVYLASDASSFTSGTVLEIDGGVRES